VAQSEKKKNYAFSRCDNERLRAELDLDRATFIPTWRDCADYTIPRRPRFFTTDNNKGDRRNQKIIDSTATYSIRTMRAGMMSGVTSPARQWFRLATPNPELNSFGDVKAWLHEVTQRMSSIFLSSNLYNVLPVLYADLSVFATAPMMIEKDKEKVVRFKSFPVGSYWIAQDKNGTVNTFFREFRMTVAQLIEQFGRPNDEKEIDWSIFSDQVKNLWDNKNHQAWIEVCHVIRPNPEYDSQKVFSKYKKFASCYYEKGTSTSNSGSQMSPDDDRVLGESGFNYFPILCPRWEVTGEDVYGTSCPAIDAIGDIKQLQIMKKRLGQAIEKMVNPPMVGSLAMRGQKTSILPGDVSYVDEREGMKGFRPAHEVNLRVGELTQEINEIKNTIKRAFYEDLFLMLSQTDRRDITAREVDERHEEKLLALGPVLQQLDQDLLDPLIDVTFQIMIEENLLPEPPEQLQGVALRVEYISIMAQAQKMVGVSSLERLFSFAGQVAAYDPSVLDKLNSPHGLEVYADQISTPPGVIRTDEEAQAIAQARAKQQQMMAQQEAMANMGKTARDLSSADMSGDNALNRLSQAGQPSPDSVL
jgi:hypothetical protein